jgi:hypothetical protein
VCRTIRRRLRYRLQSNQRMVDAIAPERDVKDIPRLHNQRLTIKAELSLAYQLKLEFSSVVLSTLRNRKNFPVCQGNDLPNARTRLRKGGKMTNGTRTFEYSIRKSKSCPVCGESSYSKDGIHPQCAVQLADESRKEQLHAARKASQAGEPKQKSWNKQCPQCKSQLHVRRKECDCGHVFRQTKSPSKG